MTCEGCKGFFRRTVLKGIQFTCPFTQSCPVTKAKRRQCQACRYKKCLAVGMRKDSISPGFSLQPPVRLHVHNPDAQGSPESAFSSLYLLPSHEDNSEEVLPDVFSLLPLFADLSTFMIQQVIQFAKAIPAFRNLPMDDQISLLKGATLEICQIQFNMVFNEETNAWKCGPHCYTIQDGALAGLQQVYLDTLLKFHTNLRKLRLHEAEYVLLQALVLFYPDHIEVTQREEIDRTQEKIALTLKKYIDRWHPWPEGRFLYAKLLLLLTELRSLKVENTRQIHHIDDRQNLSSMTPLLSEIINHIEVTQREEIDRTQEKIALTLKKYIDRWHPWPEGRFLYAKLLLLLTELRSLKVENTRQIHHIDDRQNLSSMTPLLSEIIS
ncbi:nuclear receptor subfamily 1 group I member 3 [Protobothrops mucrosquamatus]|uniref:nuclear receptor subfamily 1 group I member 3 n=1 Tax=Protobothrops mucrosquamatus TaxID=103944 RepID=UPI0010FB0039|nr:nuclear receptor subfamily 1 group I member 3 [Protobothrops mucrosquamatus]